MGGKESLAEWQQRLLPVMIIVLIVGIVVFLGLSLYQTNRLQKRSPAIQSSTSCPRCRVLTAMLQQTRWQSTSRARVGSCSRCWRHTLFNGDITKPTSR